jgi:hypothetical protein
VVQATLVPSERVFSVVASRIISTDCRARLDPTIARMLFLSLKTGPGMKNSLTARRQLRKQRNEEDRKEDSCLCLYLRLRMCLHLRFVAFASSRCH